MGCQNVNHLRATSYIKLDVWYHIRQFQCSISIQDISFTLEYSIVIHVHVSEHSIWYWMMKEMAHKQSTGHLAALQAQLFLNFNFIFKKGLHKRDTILYLCKCSPKIAILQ